MCIISTSFGRMTTVGSSVGSFPLLLCPILIVKTLSHIFVMILKFQVIQIGKTIFRFSTKCRCEFALTFGNSQKQSAVFFVAVLATLLLLSGQEELDIDSVLANVVARTLQSLFSAGLFEELDEAKAFALSSFQVFDDVRGPHSSEVGKVLLDHGFGGPFS